jgi:hypothetical protein
MDSDSNAAPVSKSALWAGRIISGLPVLGLLFSAILKFIQPAGAEMDVEMKRLGWEGVSLITLGIVELSCTIIYVIPRTAVLGAILLAAYLGGATATHVRIGDPFFGPIIFGILLWLGLYLRDPRLRALVPLRG